MIPQSLLHISRHAPASTTDSQLPPIAPPAAQEAAASCSWRLAAAYGGKPEELTIESCGDLLLQALREESNAPGLQFIQSAATGRAASRQSVRRRLSDAGESVSDVDNVSTLNGGDTTLGAGGSRVLSALCRAHVIKKHISVCVCSRLSTPCWQSLSCASPPLTIVTSLCAFLRSAPSRPPARMEHREGFPTKVEAAP